MDRNLPECIVPFDTLDDGISFRFRGIERESETDEPIGELVDVELIVPTLSLATLKRTRALIERIAKPSTVIEQIADVVEVTERALRQNYRRVPRWLIDQTINVANVNDFASSLLDASGLLRKEQLEKKARQKAATSETSTSTAFAAI